MVQVKYLYAEKIPWDKVAKQLSLSTRLLWIQSSIDEESESPPNMDLLTKNCGIKRAYDDGQLAFISGVGAMSPHTFDSLLLSKWFVSRKKSKN